MVGVLISVDFSQGEVRGMEMQHIMNFGNTFVQSMEIF